MQVIKETGTKGDGMPNDPKMNQSKETRHERQTHETEKSKKENGKIKCGTTEKSVCERDMEKRKEKRDQQWKSLVDHKPRIWPAPHSPAQSTQEISSIDPMDYVDLQRALCNST